MWQGPVESESWGKGVAEKNVFHIYRADLDGSNLTQLTFGIYNDNHPWQLPNGRVVFVSSRRPGNDKCVANKAFTLFSVKGDGTDLYPISWHETPEYYPSVDNDGMIMYTRWDYVDRGSATCHHLWTCYPDGRDPRAPHGNYMHPWIDRGIPEAYEYFNYSEPDYNGCDDGRVLGPYIEYCFRPIPNSHKIVCISGKHHPSGVGGNVGPLMIVDPRIEDDGITSQLRRITSYLHNEGEGPCKAPQEVRPDFSVPWPLSEDFYLTSWGTTLVLLDRFGNQEPLYADNMRPNFPAPVRPRTRPPVIASKTFQGERGEANPDYERATISVQNIYVTYPFWFPPEVVEQKKIKWMRIVQLFPRMNHTDPETGRTSRSANPMGCAGDANCRMSLGVVPVEGDGSVYCEAPVGKAIYFQALDENHMAIHSMRSITYVHPGEHLSCVGCHESKWEAPPPMEGTPRAFQRPPSPLVPELDNGPEPMNYHRLVKPVFENTCIPCHSEKNTNGIKDSDYQSFRWQAFSYGVGVGHLAANGSRQAPGFFGASYTSIGKALVPSHRDRLTDDEWNSVVMWLDLNSMEFGSDFGMDKQRAGELVWPVVDVDPANPTGVEIDQPRPDETRASRFIPSAGDRRSPELVVSGGRIRALSGSDHVPIGSVRIVDVMGRTVMRQSVTGGRQHGPIETTDVSAGTYMIYVKTPHGALSQRMVIAR